jgi:hypothetical protein
LTAAGLKIVNSYLLRDALAEGLRRLGHRVNEELSRPIHLFVMRVAIAAIVALLFLNFVDEQFNTGRYTKAAVSMAGKVFHSFG